MSRIWAPWRIEYIESEKPAGCILCEKPAEDNDEANYILYRGRLNFVILNAYPYNPGHLMVAPYRHLAGVAELTDEERNEHFEMVTRCTNLLQAAVAPQGYNIGMNLGRVAGAGIEDHIHSHIVPRWNGDTNFMPVLADVRVMPQALADTYRKLREHIGVFGGRP
ncbi:HIT domain-containing protein [Chloroflexota bacterium]